MRNLTILALVVLLSSCSFVNKTFNKSKDRKKESVDQTIDSAASTISDSSTVKKADSSSLTTSDSKSESWWKIDIDTSQPSTVIITPEGEIRATGKIASVKTKNVKTKNDLSKIVKSTQDSSSAHNQQTATVSKHDQRTTDEKSKDIVKEKKSVRMAWWLWLLALGAVIYILYRKYKSYSLP